jgi:hypothetical protein
MFSIKNFLILTTLQLGAYSGFRYLIPLITPVLYLLAALYRGNVRFPRNLLILAVIYSPVILIGCIRSTDFADLLFSVIKATLPFALFSISYCAFYAQRYRTIERYLERIILFTILIGCIECIVRYYVVFSTGQNALENFYIAKMYSPFFVDSNATALFLTVGLFLTVTLAEKRFKHKLFKFILLGLIFLSLSRAAIVGAVMFVMIIKIRDLPLNFRILAISTCVFFAWVLLPVAYGLVSSDGSGVTKIQVYDVFFSKIVSDELSFSRIFLGDGMSQGSFTYGYQEGKFSHALIPMLVGQIGIIGSCFWAVFVLCALYKVNVYIIFALFACIFVPGLSYAHPFYEFFYVSLGIASSTRSWKY